MTEKRFTLEEFGLNFIVNDNGRNLTAKQTVDRLNELNDENEQLKKILGFLKNDNAEDILNVLNSQENRIWELKQENEQLKSELAKIKRQEQEVIEYLRAYHKGDVKELKSE